MPALFAGQAALVTGGTSGIGRAIAQAFQAEGCAVTVTGVTADEVARSQAECPELRAVTLDVSDEAAVTNLVAGRSRLDVLVNCAGIILRGGAEFDPASFSASWT